MKHTFCVQCTFTVLAVSETIKQHCYYEYLFEIPCSTIKYGSLGTYCSGDWVCSRAGLDVMSLRRIEPRFLGRLAHIPLLHRLLYRGSYAQIGFILFFKVRYKTNLKQSSVLI
jgi:hypothetical protein